MQKHTQRERETRIYEVRQDAYILGAEERDILIYTRVQTKLQEILSRTHFSLISKIWVTSFIYRGRRKPQNSPGRIRINSEPIAKSAVNRPVGAQCSSLLQDLLERPIDWSVDRSKGFLLYYLGRSTNVSPCTRQSAARSTKVLSKSLKNSIVHVFDPLSTFSTSVQIFKIWVKFLWTLGEIDTRSRLEPYRKNQNTISTKSTHDLDFSNLSKIGTWFRRNWHTISASAIGLHHYGCLHTPCPWDQATHSLPK